ncbi:amidohydrolase [Zhihengliuella alba]|uniref:Amidohydrolase n=1 Tax=Zhihengliuella alba TaxID=547018 RepID=A0ABP7CPX5_9MICC
MAHLVMYRNGSVYSPADPFATAMLVEDGTVAWVGQEAAAASLLDDRMDVVDLRGALIAPAFFDSHVHLTELGASLEQLDLSAVRDAAGLLAAVRAQAATAPGEPVLGAGWDESRWDTPELPTAAQLSAAAGGAPVYLARADVHSALVSPAVLEAGIAPGTAAPGTESAHVAGERHAELRRRALDYDDDTRRRYQRAALAHLAARGVAGVAEMAAPQISGARDAELLRELLDAAGDDLPLVRLYWGELVDSAETARAVAGAFGPRLAGLGGDLNIDGSLGSRTAALSHDYSDAPGESGTLMLDADQVARHLVACTEAGLQAAFHVIGDGAARVLAEGLRIAMRQVGAERLQALRHRVEHAEMIDDDVLGSLLEAGFTASMQPGFDARWGGPGGLYEQRLGPERATGMNQIGRLLAAGVPVCLGSDAPVLPIDPWASVKACLELSDASSRISARAAFVASTRAGYRAAGVDVPFAGQLVPGAAATFAVWSASELMVQTPDSRVAAWSTDARAGTPMLPALDDAAPECLRTVREGRILFESPAFQGAERVPHSQ